MIVLWPLKCVVVSYRLRSSKTGVSASHPFQDVSGLAPFAVHVDGEDSIVSEERFLPFGGAAVGAVCVGLEQLAQREPVGGFGGAELGVDGHIRAPIRSRLPVVFGEARR